jgi:hypothetical protein
LTNPTALRWGHYGDQLPRVVHTHTNPRMTTANASSISRPGGTVGWLWNLRSEQGNWTIHAAPRWPGTRLGCYTGLLVYPPPRGRPQAVYRSCSFFTNQDEPITVAPVSSRSAPQSMDRLPIQNPPLARISRKTGRLGWAPPDQLDCFPSSQLLYGPNYGEKRSDADKVTVSRTRVAYPPSIQGKSIYRTPGQHTRVGSTQSFGPGYLGTTTGPR